MPIDPLTGKDYYETDPRVNDKIQKLTKEIGILKEKVRDLDRSFNLINSVFNKFLKAVEYFKHKQFNGH